VAFLRRRASSICAPVGREADLFGLLTASRLRLYGCAVAAIYVCFFVSVYRAGSWIVGPGGAPVYTDFACGWIAAVQALNGEGASLYDPTSFTAVQAAFVGPREDLYPYWPYPPIFLLIMAPFAALPYFYAFVAWDMMTLAGSLIVVNAIVRRPTAIALALASPFTAWNFLAAQNGFLTASLVGGSLLLLERRPALAGVLIGCLTYKPQFGVLFPVALVAAKQWRAIASAAVTTVLLAGASLAMFGPEVWRAFPRQVLAQTELNLLADPDGNWGYLQSVYGLIRTFHRGAGLASLAQGLTTLAAAILVWVVWRSRTRFSLKAALLSAAALIATPYAFMYDMAALMIPAAFLVRDQISRGWLEGEPAAMVGLFGTALAFLVLFGDAPGGVTFGSMPIGVLAALVLSGVILRRIACHTEQPAGLAVTGSAGSSAAATLSQTQRG
jgi:arabinofuranan 3-O-arabinosyltransferase